LPDKPRNKWEQALDAELIKLQKCQQEQGLKSCLPCPKLLNCNIRDTYIKSVYESMSKGAGGGFEF